MSAGSAPSTVRVLHLWLDGNAAVVGVEPTLATWQRFVGGGYIEFVLLAWLAEGEQLVAIVNEEGQATQPASPWIWPAGLGTPGQPIYGPFVIARWRHEPDGDDHAVDLDDANLRRGLALFSWQPRQLFNTLRQRTEEAS